VPPNHAINKSPPCSSTSVEAWQEGVGIGIVAAVFIVGPKYRPELRSLDMKKREKRSEKRERVSPSLFPHSSFLFPIFYFLVSHYFIVGTTGSQ
jgi:hypothetical protein